MRLERDKGGDSKAPYGLCVSFFLSVNWHLFLLDPEQEQVWEGGSQAASMNKAAQEELSDNRDKSLVNNSPIISSYFCFPLPQWFMGTYPSRIYGGKFSVSIFQKRGVLKNRSTNLLWYGTGDPRVSFAKKLQAIQLGCNSQVYMEWMNADRKMKFNSDTTVTGSKLFRILKLIHKAKEEMSASWFFLYAP